METSYWAAEQFADKVIEKRHTEGGNVSGRLRLKFTHNSVVVGSGVPAGHAENSPAIHGWVDHRRLTRVPEGRLNDSIVPPGLEMQCDSLSQR